MLVSQCCYAFSVSQEGIFLFRLNIWPFRYFGYFVTIDSVRLGAADAGKRS